MTVRELATSCGYEILSGEESLSREIKSVYCCDLLSFAMGRAPEDGAWVTVMGNVNAVAVAVLTDTACIILAEGAALDADAKARADQNDIAILRSQLPIFETALTVKNEGAAS